MAEDLLGSGHRVAVSGLDTRRLQALKAEYDDTLLRLPAGLHHLDQAQLAGQQLQARWGAVDTLIVDAGTCEYLPTDVPTNEMFDQILTTNWQACEHALAVALPLLARGEQPRIMAVFSRYSALQRYSPAQSPAGHNSLPHWLREQRKAFADLGVQLTIVAPPSTKAPLTTAQALPELWTADSAAKELLDRLQTRQAELVLEVLDPTLLWPLPEPR